MGRHVSVRQGGWAWLGLLTFTLSMGAAPPALGERSKGRKAARERRQARPAPEAAPPSKEPTDSPAWRHFTAGRDMVNAGRLTEGVAELRAARAAGEDAPPETDFYLALAYDGLQQTEAALTAYRRYLTGQPYSVHSESVRERIKIIELRRSLQGQKQEPK